MPQARKYGMYELEMFFDVNSTPLSGSGFSEINL